MSGFQDAHGLSDVMMTGYGLAEATLCVTCTPRGARIEADERDVVCLGPPLRDTHLRIIEGERLLPPGEVGKVIVSGPAVSSGYHRNPRATAELFLDFDGARFIHTGDLGYMDAAGRLYFVARQKDLIKLAGRSLYPQEVEAIVEEVDGVRRCAAVGIDPGDIGGEQLFVFAEVRDPGDPSHRLRRVAVEIARSLHETIGVRPRRTVLLQPNRIPLTANGKLQRGRLREAYVNGLLAPGADMLWP
jgi:acyl-CoA synthetase (AMP-forming)/AMP-acid ligase II